MSKFLKEAKRVKQVLSANTETISQVCGGVFVRKKYTSITSLNFYVRHPSVCN